jgi:hypothetical protein
VILWAFSLSSFPVRKVVGLVAEPDGHMPLAVLFSVRLGLLDHPVDVSLAKRRAAGDLHGLLLAGGKILGVTCMMPLASMSNATSI